MPTDDVDEFLARIGVGAPLQSSPETDPKILRNADSLRSLLDQPDIPEGSKIQIRNQLGKWGLGAGSVQGDDVDQFLSRVLPPPPAPKPILAPDIMGDIATRDWGTPQVAAAPPAPVPQGTVTAPSDPRVSAARAAVSAGLQGQARAAQEKVDIASQMAANPLAEWWHSGGKAMPPDEIAKLGPEYVAEYEYQTGKRPTIYPSSVTPAEEVRAGFYSGFMPGSPNVPEDVQFVQQAAVSGPGGVLARGVGAIAGYAANPLWRIPGTLAERAVAGPMAAAIADNIESAQAVIKAAESKIAAGAAPWEAERLAELARQARYFIARQSTLGEMTSGTRGFVAQHVAGPAAVGATMAAPETARAYQRGEITAAEIPENIAGSALAMVLMDLGWTGFAQALKAVGIMPMTIVEKMRAGRDLTPQEQRLVDDVVAAHWRPPEGPTPPPPTGPRPPTGMLPGAPERPPAALPPGPPEPTPPPTVEATPQPQVERRARQREPIVPLKPYEQQIVLDAKNRALAGLEHWHDMLAKATTEEEKQTAIRNILRAEAGRRESEQLLAKTPQPWAQPPSPFPKQITVGPDNLLVPEAPEEDEYQKSADALRKMLEQQAAAQPTERRVGPEREIDDTKIRPEVHAFAEQYVLTAGKASWDAIDKIAPLNRDEERLLAFAIEEAASRRPPAPGQDVFLTPEEQEFVKKFREAKGRGEQPPEPPTVQPAAPPAGPAKAPRATASARRQTIAAGLGHWWEEILAGGPLKYDHIVDTAGPEIATEISKRFPGGTIIAKDGQQLDEIASRLAAQGFEGGDEIAARNKILEMLEDLAKKPRTGRAVKAKAAFGKPDPSIAGLTKTEYAGDLKDGEEILTADGSYWTVKAGKGAVKLTRGDGKTITLDEFDPVPVVSHLSVSEGGKPYAPERKLWTDLTPEEQAKWKNHIATRKDAIERMEYPVEGVFDGEKVQILGPADRFSPYKEDLARSGGPSDPFQLLVKGADGRRFIAMAESLKLGTGEPLIRRAPFKMPPPTSFLQATIPGAEKPISQQAMIEERLRQQKQREIAAKLGDRQGDTGPLFEPKQSGLFPPGTKGVSEPKAQYGIEPFQRAPDEMKRHLIAVGGYHMKRGATDLPALTAALTKAIGPAIEPYVPGLHAVLSKLPAFAPPKGAEHGPVRVGHAQQQPEGAPSRVRVRPPEGERPAARPEGGGQPQPPQAPRPSPQGAGAAAPYAPESGASASAGILTVSRDLLPAHSGEDAALLKRLSSPQGLEELRQLLGGRTPMPHQVDAFVRIRRAHLDGHGYVLADGTGTGKTTVAAMTVASLLKEKPEARILVVLRNPDLVRQWTNDVLSPMRAKTNLYRGAFGFQPRTVNFMTYATMERLWSSDQFGKVTEGFKPDLLIFDESHALKNFYTGDTSTALAGERLQTFAGRVLHLSATPFESALHTGYASGLKLWWPERDWRSFLSSAFDIYYDAQRGLWMGLSPKKLKAIHELLYSSNRMLKNELDFGQIVNSRGEHVTLTTENLFAPRTEAQRDEHERIAEFFPQLIAQLQQTPGTKPSHIRLVRGLEYMVHRSLDEAQKLPHAIAHAQRAIDEGKSVIFMLLRKGDTSMERWMQEYESGERTYKPWSRMPEFIAAMKAHGIEIPSPVRTLEAAFPGAVKITGDQPAGGPLRRSAIDRFQSGDAQVAIVTMSAGAEGLNLQDRTGVRPRAMYVISVPYNATQATQVAGRPFRVGSETNAETYWLFNDTPADRRVAGALAETLRNQHAILRGENVVPTADEIERFQFNELNTETSEPEAPSYGVAEEQLEFKLQSKPGGMGPQGEAFIQISTLGTGARLSIPNMKFRGPQDAAAIFDGLKNRPTEAAYVLYMRGDTPIAAQMIGMGQLARSETEPRFIYSGARHLGSDRVMFAHNHPSGSPIPSSDDHGMTALYKHDLASLGIKVLGHVVIDIDNFGWIDADGAATVIPLDPTRLQMRAGSIPVVEPVMNRLAPKPSQAIQQPEHAGAYFMTRLKNRDTTSTLFIATDVQNKVSASLLLDGGPTTILATDESLNAVRKLVADTMPMSIIAVTNEPGWSPNARAEITASVHSILGAGPAKLLLQDVVIADTSRTKSEETTYLSARGTGFMSGPAGTRIGEPTTPYAVSEPDRVKARQAIIDEFLEALDTKARIGRMGFLPRSVRAFYNQRTGVIRQRLHGDIDAAVVEGGRRIYDLLFRLAPGGRLEDVGPKQYRRFKSELVALARPSALTIPPIEQGFSHFIHMYVKEPAQAKAVAPEFLPWFEAKLEATAPKIKYALDALRSDWADYRRADPRSRGLLTIQSSTLPLGRIKNGTPFERAYDAIFDSMAPVRRVTNDLLRLRGGGKLPASEDARALAQLVTARFALAQHMWETGIGLFGKPVEVVSPAPKDLAREIGPDWKDYELYAKTRRGLEEVKRGFDMEKDIGLEQDSADWAMENLHEKHKAHFAKARKIFRAILQWHHDAGFMTDEAFKATVESHPDYSALYRLMDEEIQPRGGVQSGPGTRHTGLWSAIRRFRGSPRPTIPSLEAMAKMLYTIVDRGERNNLAVKLVQLGLSTVGGGRYIEEVPEERWPVVVPVRKALDALRDLGITPREVDVPESALDERLVFFQPSWMTPPRPYDWVWIKGRRRLFRFPEPVYDALRGLNREPMNFIIKLLGWPKRALQSGAIAYVPPAWAWLAMKKIPADFIESQDPVGLAKRIIPALFSMLQKDKEYDKFMRSGGAMAGFITVGRREGMELLRREIEKETSPGAYWANPANVIREILAFGRYLAFSTESAARLAEAQGLWPKDAASRAQLSEGAITARNLGVDYSVKGAISGLINELAAFYTAWIGGYRSAGKALKDRPVRTSLQWLLFSVPLTVWLYLHNRKQKSYAELSPHERFKYHHWADDENLTSPVRVMPRPFVWGQADAMVEAALQWIDNQDPKALDDFANEFAKSNNPLVRAIPTATLPVLENFANLNINTGAPVSPERGLPSEAYYPWTTETAKTMGRALNYPPAKIEHLAQGWLGTAGTAGLQLSDVLTGRTGEVEKERQSLPFLGRFLTYPGRATADSLTRVYELWDESQRAYQSYRHKLQTEPENASEFFLANEDLIQRYYRLRGQMKRLGAERRSGMGIPDINRDAREILDREQELRQ